MDLTVIICSYNRASSLFNTLVSLEQQALPAGRTWEVVVVNNNSSDRTEDVIGEFVRKGNLSLRYVFEKQQGLPYARNAGIKQAAGEILAFTDDDCITNSDWILSICNEFKSNPSVSGIGGRVELYDSRDKPVTIRPFKERIAFESTAQLFYLVPGCNMAFRREVFEAIGGFDPDFGSGKGLVVDDTDFIYRAFKHGFKIVYSPDVLVYHNHGRRTDDQIRPLKKGYLRGRGGFYCKHVLAGDGDVLKMAYWEIKPLLTDFLKKLCLMQSPSEEACVIANLATGAAYEFINKCHLARRRFF